MDEQVKKIQEQMKNRNFLTHNDKDDIQTVGTSLSGYIDITYDELVEKLGEPHQSDGYKVDAEWDLEFEDGTVATIYNYKTGKNYLGDEGYDTDEITDWHIGGAGEKSVEKVQELFPDATTRKGW